MNEPREAYKQFIDKMVDISPGVLARWVTGDGYPRTKDNKAANDLLAALTPQQKEVLARMLQDARADGIHDVLVALDAYQIVTMEDTPLPRDPFDTSLHYDYVSRLEGDEWPSETDEE